MIKTILKPTKISISVLLGALLLGACTSSATFVDPHEDRRLNLTDYVSVEAWRAQMDNLTREPFSPDTVTGSANYDGVILISGDDRIGSRVGGKISIDVSFDDATLTGVATNFYREDTDAAVSDQIYMDGTTVNPGNVRANLTGDLQLEDGTEVSYAENINGVFRNDTATGFTGESGVFLPTVTEGEENYATIQFYADGAGVSP